MNGFALTFPQRNTRTGVMGYVECMEILESKLEGLENESVNQ
jgi:hypothetical protein